jgi:hypothetical protein
VHLPHLHAQKETTRSSFMATPSDRLRPQLYSTPMSRVYKCPRSDTLLGAFPISGEDMAPSHHSLANE